MVLAIMISFLVWRVYVVVRPPEAEETTTHYPPKPELPKDPPPPVPKPVSMPTSPKAMDFTTLTMNNMFWFFSRPISGSDPGSETIDITLLSVTPFPDGTHRVRLQTRAGKRLYKEGAQFENYELRKINPPDPDRDFKGSVQIYSEELGRTFEIEAR